MSKEIVLSSQEIGENFLRTLTNEQKIFFSGFLNLDQKGLVINWDLDQTLAITENPVKNKLGIQYKKDFSQKRVDGWDSISKWLIVDGVDANEAVYEERLAWRSNELLSLAEPNEYLRALSYEASKREIPQYITTFRSTGLRQMTYKWVKKYYDWIPAGHVNFRVASNVRGEDFKIDNILALFDRFPGLITVDDDLTIIKPLAKVATAIGIIGIKYPSDDVSDLNHTATRVFVERDTLSSLIPYPLLTS